MKDEKFIVVQDELVANQLIAAGFQLMSQINKTYTFINTIPQSFKFENIDIKKLAFTNRLTF